jgi:hypothetical protein
VQGEGRLGILRRVWVVWVSVREGRGTGAGVCAGVVRAWLRQLTRLMGATAQTDNTRDIRSMSRNQQGKKARNRCWLWMWMWMWMLWMTSKRSRTCNECMRLRLLCSAESGGN